MPKKGIIQKTFDFLESTIITDVTINFNNQKKKVKALWDTGSEIIVLSHKLAEELGFVPLQPLYGKSIINTIGWTAGKNGKPVMFTPINFDINGAKVDGILATDYYDCVDNYYFPPNCDLLIGMPLIGRGDFNIKSSTLKTVFTFKLNKLINIIDNHV